MVQINLKSDLLNYIIAEGYAPGDSLPSIKELASSEHLGISISKVREQLEVARALGLVDVRSRTGTRLREFDFAPAVRTALLYALAQNVHRFEDFHDLRIGIEVSFWEDACVSLTTQCEAQMQDAIHEAQRKLNSHPVHIPLAEHRRFHLALFAGINNPFVYGMLEAYWDAYDQVAANHYADYDYLQRVWTYHANILNAIKEREYKIAKDLFVEHTRLRRYQHTATHNGDQK